MVRCSGGGALGPLHLRVSPGESPSQTPRLVAGRCVKPIWCKLSRKAPCLGRFPKESVSYTWLVVQHVGHQSLLGLITLFSSLVFDTVATPLHQLGRVYAERRAWQHRWRCSSSTARHVTVRRAWCPSCRRRWPSSPSCCDASWARARASTRPPWLPPMAMVATSPHLRRPRFLAR
jgi:hypothetical protein